MTRKHIPKYSLIAISLLLALLISGTASATWWDGDWSSLSTITLNTSIPDNNLQVHLSSESFAIPAKMWANMNKDGNDTRILHTDNTTVFPIWIEHLTARDNYSILVNVTDNTTNTHLLWYYGNPNASSVSDGDSSFILFFDGNSTQWTEVDPNSHIAFTNDRLEFTGLSRNEDVYVYKSINENNNIIIESTYHIISGNSQSIVMIGTVGDTLDDFAGMDNGFAMLHGVSTSQSYAALRIADTSYLGGGVAPTTGTTYYSRTTRKSNTVECDWYTDIDRTSLAFSDSKTQATLPTNLEYVFLINSYNSGSPLALTGWIDDFRVRKYTANEPIITDINLTVFTNSPPGTPAVIYPTNTSNIVSYGDVELNVLSTDVDNDTLTYSFYGDMVDGSTYLGTNDTVNGTTHNWSITQYGIYYWKAIAYDGFNYSAYSTVSQFTLIIPPNLTAPTNTSTTYTTYPPLTSSVLITWQDMAAPQYRIMIAEDINFNVMSADSHIGTNNSIQLLLVNKQYYWKIYSYDGTTYSDSSVVYIFNLTGNSSLTGSAIEGVVYQSNGNITAIPGAEVTVWNSTWSSSMITGSNGYYVFEDLNDETVYNLQAKSDRYWDSSIALVTAESDPVTNNFYLIDDLTDTEWWHYVEFTLQNVWGVTYPNVATTVYIGDSPTISESGNTESDGAISFHLNQNVQYHITFIDSTHGINEDITLYPVATSYTVYIDSYSFDLPETVTDDIQAYIVSSRINATHGYINFTWSDTSGLTSSINYYIHDVDGNELYNTSNSGPNMFNSQIVAATDDRYIVWYVGVHPTHGIIDKTETVVFHGGRRVDFGWPHDWQYAVTALAFLIFIGALFGAKTAHYGAITVVIFAWIFKWIGWLNETNTSTLLIILAAVIAFGWSLRKSEEVKT